MRRILLLLTFSLMLAGCRTSKVVTVVEHHTDTLRITKQERDSIFLRDSIYVHEWTKADTVYLLQEKWHTKYIESIRIDTIYQAKVDSIPIPYEVERIVYRQRWWQKALAWAGLISIVSLVVVYIKR